jgi:hypothetical protein
MEIIVIGSLPVIDVWNSFRARNVVELLGGAWQIVGCPRRGLALFAVPVRGRPEYAPMHQHRGAGARMHTR